MGKYVIGFDMCIAWFNEKSYSFSCDGLMSVEASIRSKISVGCLCVVSLRKHLYHQLEFVPSILNDTDN